MPEAPKKSVVFEKTPKYFVTENVPERINEFFKGKRPKFILLVCDPVNRLLSEHNMIVNSKRNYLINKKVLVFCLIFKSRHGPNSLIFRSNHFPILKNLSIMELTILV